MRSMTLSPLPGVCMASNNLMVNYQDSSVSLVFLKDIFAAAIGDDLAIEKSFDEQLNSIGDDEVLNVIMAKHSGRKIGLVVDKLLRQKEIIEKKLPKPLDSGKLLSGSTILGSGNVCPVLDIASIMDSFFQSALKNQAV